MEIIEDSDGFRLGIELAKHWIDVKEPPINQDIVLVKDEYENVFIGYYHGKNSDLFITYGEEAYIKTGKITHWRPI